MITYLPFEDARVTATVLTQKELAEAISAGIKILSNWPKALNEKWPPDIKNSALLWINRDGKLYLTALKEYISILHERYIYNQDKKAHDPKPEGVLKNRPRSNSADHPQWSKFVALRNKEYPATTVNFPVWHEYLHKSHQIHLTKMNREHYDMHFKDLPANYQLLEIEYIRPRDN